ncbi:MAG: cytochrome c oxidase subunit II [Thioalkalispiraceae bacterium]
MLANSDGNIINIEAQRYGYIPEVIKVPAGRAVTLHIKSLDVLHGFYIPDINVRVDLKPGASTVVELPALKPGKYQFLCDIFCGTGHSGMNGYILVFDKNGK